MSVLLYASSAKGPAERLRTMIKTFVPRRKIEVLGSIERLSKRLREPKGDEDIGILLAASKDELKELLSVTDLLEDLRVILVLPDKEADTISKGHRLRPRFLSYGDSNFVDVAAVLGKMLAGNNAS